LVNGELISYPKYLKKGDFVQLLNYQTSIKNMSYRRKYSKVSRILSYVEVDYYLSNFVIVCDLNISTPEEIQIVTLENFNQDFLLPV
jgi:hypothetical protein